MREHRCKLSGVVHCGDSASEVTERATNGLETADPTTASMSGRAARAIAIGLIWLKSVGVGALLIIMPLLGSKQDPAGRAIVEAGFALGCL